MRATKENTHCWSLNSTCVHICVHLHAHICICIYMYNTYTYTHKKSQIFPQELMLLTLHWDFAKSMDFFVWYTLYCGESTLQFLSFQGRLERNSQHDSIEHTKLTCMFYLIPQEKTCDIAGWICIYYINYEVHSGIW